MKVKITFNRNGFFYEDPEMVGEEFEVFKSPNYLGLCLLFPAVDYIVAPGLWILETDCQIVE